MDSAHTRLTKLPSWLLTQTAAHAHRLVTTAFTQTGARGYHYRLLAALAEYGPTSQASLGRRCQIDRSDVVAAINQLAADGLVERGPDPTDRRRNTITLTTTGHRQLKRLEKRLAAVQADLLAPLTATERETLTKLLTKLLAHHSGTAPDEPTDARP